MFPWNLVTYAHDNPDVMGWIVFALFVVLLLALNSRAEEEIK